MPNHEAKVKPIVAEQKKKKNSAGQEMVLSAQPASGTVSVKANNGKDGNQNSNKAFDYLDKYKSQHTKSANSGNQPVSGIKPISIPPATKKTLKAENKTTNAKPAKIDKRNTAAYLSSLQQQQPTAFIGAMKNADADSNSMHVREKDQLQKELPVIDQPTGLPTLDKAGGNKAVELDAARAADMKRKNGGKTKRSEKPVKITTDKPIVKSNPILVQKKVDNPGFFKKILAESVHSLPVTDESIETSLGPRPTVDLSGEADPQQVDQHNAESDADVMSQQANAQKLTQQDFGENNIYPDIKREKLSPKNKITPVIASKGKPVIPPKVSAEISASFDKAAAAQVQEQVDAQVIKNDEAVSRMNDDKKAENKNHMQQIRDQELAAKNDQKEEQHKAKTEVTQQRVNWQNENEKIRDDYVAKSKAKRAEVDGKVEEEVNKGNQDIENKYAESEREIAEENEKAEAEAEKKKKEAEEKQDSGGFFSAIGDFFSDVWDGIKSAVNFIFDKLRKFVKGVIELAKKAVNYIIDKVRDAVVSFIKAFGEALKLFVSVALAAFPELAKKINAKIDKAVNYAVDKVNKLAENLKKAVNKLLDALGAVLDTILAVYQQAFNMLIDALKFITVGLMKILQGIEYLVKAAYQSPDHFWAQVSLEVIGQDITNPLPNEIGYDQGKDESQVGEGFETIKYTKNLLGISEEDNKLLAQPELTSNDIINPEVDNDFKLSPELTAQLSGSGDKTIEFGETPENATALDDARTDALKQTVVPTQPSMPVNEPVMKTSPSATAGKVGPFKNAWERGQYVLGQVKDAISKWWAANKVKVIAGLVAGLLAGIVLEVVTGGAITAAIPVIMDILALLFGVQDFLDAIVYLGDYITNSWVGKIVKGAMSLARVFVKLIMVFIFDLIGGGAIFKGIKNTMKAAEKGGVKGVMKLAKTGTKNVITKEVKNFVKLGEIAKNGAKATLKNGKLVLSGLRSGLKQGAKSLDEIAAGLLKKFRFKKFIIVIRRFRFYLYGEVNPWVLLASGNLKELTQDQLRALSKEKKTFKVGDDLVIDGEKAFVVGSWKKGSELVNALRSNPALAKRVADLANTLSDDLSNNLVKGILKLTNKAEIENILKAVEELRLHKVSGLDKVLREFASGGKRTMGAEWVLIYLGKNEELLKGVTKLEAVAPDVGRVYDAVINGINYEFKNWKSFVAPGFLEQFSKDIKLLLEDLQSVRWVFSSRIGDKAELIKQARELLRAKIKLDLSQLVKIEKKLSSIIIVAE